MQKASEDQISVEQDGTSFLLTNNNLDVVSNQIKGTVVGWEQMSPISHKIALFVNLVMPFTAKNLPGSLWRGTPAVTISPWFGFPQGKCCVKGKFHLQHTPF